MLNCLLLVRKHKLGLRVVLGFLFLKVACSTGIDVSKDQTVKRLPKSVGYVQSSHKLSRFGREKLNLKDKYSGNDGVKFEETKSEDTNVASDSLVEKHESVAKESNGVACNTYNNRCLTYTFSRRHKKVLSSKSGNYSSHGNINILVRES
ncbi:hypothetical protein HanXRQr2_Chr15g0711511 [Helianthus annuus]|uniref:Uncharacterized protein n=1 Tax=Helianthus annuus TaxID=4232 RepID=A0A9K3E3A1_HELAN|nr:hypothetical protein HanXRQr2_Chr15g0711511 [Helianthus annuus]